VARLLDRVTLLLISVCLGSSAAVAQSNVHEFSCTQGFSGTLCKPDKECKDAGVTGGPDDILIVTGISTGSQIRFTFTDDHHPPGDNNLVHLTGNGGDTGDPTPSEFEVPPPTTSAYIVTSADAVDGQSKFRAELNNTGGVPRGERHQVDYTVSCAAPPPHGHGHIIIEKELDISSDPGANDPEFNFTIDGNHAATLRPGETTQEIEVSVGEHQVAELTPPADWTLTGVSCGNQQNPATVSVSDGGTVICAFTNKFAKTCPPTPPKPPVPPGPTPGPPAGPAKIGGATICSRAQQLAGLFIHRRVDNLLTYGPDRARILRRLQEEAPPSLKEEPLKFSGQQTGAAPLGNDSTIMPDGVSLYNSGKVQDGLQGISEIAGDGVLAGTRGTGSSGNSILSSLGLQFLPLADNPTSFKFSTSLSELRAEAAEAAASEQQEKAKAAGLGFTSQPYMNPYTTMGRGLDVWLEGQISHYNDNVGGIDRDGDFGILYAGADYVLRPGLLIGALVQVDDTRENVDNRGLKGDVSGVGWMAGPYIGVRLTDWLFFNARGAWGTSGNDISLSDEVLGRGKRNFDTDRWLASADLTGNHYFGPWRVSPQITIGYGHEAFDGFINRNDSQAATIGRLTGGAEIGYRIQMSGGTIVEPTGSISGIWNFDDSSDLALIGVPLDNTDEARAKVEGGVILRTPRGWAFRAAGAYDGIGGSDFNAYSGSFWLNIPLN
jgi:hypothetical protein